MAESRRKSPKPVPQGPGQSIPFDHPDRVAPDDHFEIEVAPETQVEKFEQPRAQPGGDARPTGSEGRPEADAGTDFLSAADETPEENWSLEKLARYATRAEERARRFGHLESAERFRLGKALHFAHKKIQWGEWNAWLDKTFTFSRMTAWRAEQLYLRATERYGERAEEACGNQSITDLYIALRIKKKDEWLIQEDDEQSSAGAEAQGAQQPTAKKGQAKKRNRAKGKDQSQRAPIKPATPPGGNLPSSGDGEQPGEPGSGDDAEKPQGTLPDDPRRHAEALCKQKYATDGLIRMGADCLYDGLARFETTMPNNEEKAVRLALVRLEQIKDHADRLIRLYEAQREASR
jgi:hypothetical protein